MCGIVGILGQTPVAGLLVDSLKRLEYRGYDSAGVATLEDGRLTRRRAEGKLRNLEAKLLQDPLKGRIGKDPVDDVTASYTALALGKAGGDADLGAMVNAMTAPTTTVQPGSTVSSSTSVAMKCASTTSRSN